MWISTEVIYFSEEKHDFILNDTFRDTCIIYNKYAISRMVFNIIDQMYDKLIHNDSLKKMVASLLKTVSKYNGNIHLYLERNIFPCDYYSECSLCGFIITGDSYKIELLGSDTISYIASLNDSVKIGTSKIPKSYIKSILKPSVKLCSFINKLKI